MDAVGHPVGDGIIHQPVSAHGAQAGKDGRDQCHGVMAGTARSAWRLVTRKPLVASAEELERNPRSRSAKLRIAERIR